ncbi:MAG TPA: ABC transporter ATP-binding protein [Candidatus Magasanikbacteria bacterium]|nr:ABC transporter ATP-binding protein [Candidatus Magasanikbacteria bacterium]
MDRKPIAREFRGGGGPPGGIRMGVREKPKQFKKNFLAFIQYLKAYWGSFILVFIFAVLGTLCSVAGPKILGNMTDVIIQGLKTESPRIDFNSLGHIGFWLIGLYLVGAGFNYFQSWIMATVSQRITYALRRDISLKISRLPLRYFDQHEKGDIISRVTNDVETISQNLNQGLVQVVTAFVSLVGILIMMIIISWQMTLIALIVLPLSFFFIKQIIGRSQAYFKQQQNSLGKINGHIEEMFANHIVVKAFNGEEESIKQFNKINQKLYDSGWKSQFISGLMMPVMHLISNLGYVAVAVAGGWLALLGKVSIGGIQAFVQYTNEFTRPIVQTANIANIFQATIAAAERIFDFLDEEEEGKETKTLSAPKEILGKVEFKNVCFGYRPDKTIIKNFTAAISSRCNVAIVGPTGAGKTTIVNLLMRFYDIDKGSITIDGVDIEKMKRQEVRRMFGMVLQDTWLFNGTIAENIAFGRPESTREEIIEAAKEAHIDHFIRTLPQGYETIIADSIDNISAGEKQLLTIARAILANAPMLILDEATSSVDTRTESLIQSAMDKLTHGRTSFVIAHRLSTIKNAELILVVRDGNIVEQGTHQELLAKDSFYASLYNSQFVGQTI